MGVLNNNNFQGHIDPQARCILEALGLTKKILQSCPESCRREGRSHFCAQSVLLVREHGTMGTCLREAATAKAGNAAGGFFHQPLIMENSGSSHFHTRNPA